MSPEKDLAQSHVVNAIYATAYGIVTLLREVTA